MPNIPNIPNIPNMTDEQVVEYNKSQSRSRIGRSRVWDDFIGESRRLREAREQITVSTNLGHVMTETPEIPSYSWNEHNWPLPPRSERIPSTREITYRTVVTQPERMTRLTGGRAISRVTDVTELSGGRTRITSWDEESDGTRSNYTVSESAPPIGYTRISGVIGPSDRFNPNRN